MLIVGRFGIRGFRRVGSISDLCGDARVQYCYKCHSSVDAERVRDYFHYTDSFPRLTVPGSPPLAD